MKQIERYDAHCIVWIWALSPYFAPYGVASVTKQFIYLRRDKLFCVRKKGQAFLFISFFLKRMPLEDETHLYAAEDDNQTR